jgi:hypothetical protein
VILGCAYCCKSNRSYKEQPNLLKSFQEMKDQIIGKKVNFVDSLFGPQSRNTYPDILFVYCGMDCGSCISMGFNVMKKMKNSQKNLKMEIVGISANMGMDQLKYGYHDYIYTDEKDIIRKELHFLYTPCILVFNKNGTIKNLLFINNQYNSCDIFINQIKSFL